MHASIHGVQVEMVPEVEDSLAIGLRINGDVDVVLFVKLAPTAKGQVGGGTGGREGAGPSCL